jgi:hypothetical protein
LLTLWVRATNIAGHQVSTVLASRVASGQTSVDHGP